MRVNVALKNARKKCGYTQEDMAKLLGYKSKATYCNIENNKVKVTLDTAFKISQILNRPIDKLFPNFFKYEVQETRT